MPRFDLGHTVGRMRGPSVGRTGGLTVLCDSPFPDRLLALTLLAFEGLGTAAGKDQCLACLEEAFFPPLWAPLLALYRYHDLFRGSETH